MTETKAVAQDWAEAVEIEQKKAILILNEKPTLARRVIQFVKIWDALSHKGGIEMQNFISFLDMKSREE